MKGTQATKGHLASNGGLRGHSVDAEVFPLVIVGQYCPKLGQRWRIMRPDGQFYYRQYASAHSAHADAAAINKGWLDTMTELEFLHAGGYHYQPHLIPFMFLEVAFLCLKSTQ